MINVWICFVLYLWFLIGFVVVCLNSIIVIKGLLIMMYVLLFGLIDCLFWFEEFGMGFYFCFLMDYSGLYFEKY